jgi:hypothetical protein
MSGRKLAAVLTAVGAAVVLAIALMPRSDIGGRPTLRIPSVDRVDLRALTRATPLRRGPSSSAEQTSFEVGPHSGIPCKRFADWVFIIVSDRREPAWGWVSTAVVGPIEIRETARSTAPPLRDYACDPASPWWLAMEGCTDGLPAVWWHWPPAPGSNRLAAGPVEARAATISAGVECVPARDAPTPAWDRDREGWARYRPAPPIRFFAAFPRSRFLPRWRDLARGGSSPGDDAKRPDRPGALRLAAAEAASWRERP